MTKTLKKSEELDHDSHVRSFCDVGHQLYVLGLEAHVEELVVVTGEHVGRRRLPREAVARRRTDGVPEGRQVQAGPLGWKRGMVAINENLF